MADREKVIKGLKICSEHGSWHGLDCEHNEAYKDCPYRGCETGCIVTIAKDALVLLKEQEAIVKCKDCKYCEYQKSEKEWCKKGHLHGNAETWFCADGEKQERKLNMDEIKRIGEERFVESMISLWVQPDAPEWIIDYVRQELRKQRGLKDYMNSEDQQAQKT